MEQGNGATAGLPRRWLMREGGHWSAVRRQMSINAVASTDGLYTDISGGMQRPLPFWLCGDRGH